MSERKACPILAQATASDVPRECLEDCCAWWVEDFGFALRNGTTGKVLGGCALAVIGRSGQQYQIGHCVD